MPGAGTTPAGNRTDFFPFFSEFRGASRVALSALETAVLACIFALALAANACAIRLLARRKRRLSVASCLVLNLFCADLLFISAIPIIAVVRWTESWTMGHAVCHLLFYMMGLSGSVTILSLAAVSLERVVSIVRLRPSRAYRGRLVAGLLLLIWVVSALATLPLCLFFTVQPLSGKHQIAKESRRRLHAGMAYSEGHHIRISQKDFRLLRTLFVLMISFFLMWSPIIITILLILVQKFNPNVNLMPSLFFWIVAFTFSNSIVNPVLYNVSHFRHEWRKIFFCCPGPLGRKALATDTTLRQNNNRHFTVSAIST
ncbi:free fatty acid receptor 4 isoform X2 [Podarcis muralis]|uniref:Free fatty acid receptor 4 n=1 Tax=Podarcis muralis TaxID=64176 RepID=A0A670HXW4_PODMU